MNSLTANNRWSQQLVVRVAEHLLLRHECRLPNHLAVSNHRELYLTVGGELCRNLTAGFVTEEGFMSMLFVGNQKHSALSIFAKTTRMSALVLCGNSGVILLSVKDHQHIDSSIPVYFSVQQSYVKVRAAVDEKLANQFFYPIFDGFLLIFESFFEFIKFIIKLKVFCLNTSFCNQICGINGFLIINVIFVNELSIFPSDYCCSVLAHISEVSSDTRTIYFQFTVVIFDGHLVVCDPVTTFDENFISHTEICPFHSALGLRPHLKDIIDHADFLGYAKKAPYKAGAGRGNPKFNIEHNRAHAVFSCHEHCYAKIMVGRAGPTSVGPGSMLTGISTPVRLTTYMAVESLGGEFFEFNIGAVTMTTLPTLARPEITIANGQAVTSSLAIADYFSKRHDDVLKRVRALECSPEFNARNFAAVEYVDAKGELPPAYQITRDGFAFLAMGFTGKRAAQFKEAYINAFNQMEKQLSKPSVPSDVAHNASVLYSHLSVIHKVWLQQLYPMLAKAESPLAVSLYDRINDAAFLARLIHSSLNSSEVRGRK